jgi:glycine/D-amino acid oxidase-like deaminating enzyme
MRILVLGAELNGVTSAWFLRKAGHEVAVIDRQRAAALETCARTAAASTNVTRRSHLYSTNPHTV